MGKQASIVKEPAQPNPKECEYGPDQACRIFEEDREYGRVFASDNFIEHTLIGVLAAAEFTVGDAPRVEFK